MERDYFTPLDTYEIYAVKSTKAPLLYHKILGVLDMGHALGYDAVNLIQPSVVHHNMYGLLTGVSTHTNKSTAQDLANKVYPPEASVPIESSPEEFVVQLAEKPNRIWWMPEFSAIVKGLRGGYMARYASLLNDLHRCPPIYHRKLREKKKEAYDFVVEKPYLSCCSTITPSVLNELMTPEIAVGGFLARWLMVPGLPTRRPREMLEPEVFRREDAFRIDMEKMIEKQCEMHFVFSEEAFKRYNELEDSELDRTAGLDNPFVGRYFNYLIAFADVLMVDDILGMASEELISYDDFDDLYGLVRHIQLERLERSESLDRLDIRYKTRENNRDNGSNQSNRSNHLIVRPVIVDVQYVDQAWELIRPCLEYATAFVEEILLDRPIARLRTYIRENGQEWIDHSTVMRGTGLSAANMKLASQTLTERDEILKKEEQKPTATGIRTVIHYKWKGA